MEVLTRPPPHQDAPMDLSTTARRMLGRSPWTRHAQVERAVEPRAKATPEGPSRYIPIPKKRHCHAPQPQGSPRRECQSPSPVRQSPPASTQLRARSSLSPEMSRKRARMESPKPSDLCCDLTAQPPSSADRNDAVPTSATSPTTSAVSASDSSGGGGEWPAVGAGPAGANGEVVVAGEGVSQSVMKPRQRGHPSSVESSYATSPPGLREESSEGMPSSQLFTALLHMQSAAISQGMLPTALKDTEALLSAVHQSQMLYYSYCSQLIHTLRAKQIEQQQHHQQQQQHHQLNHHHHHNQQQHQLHQHHRLYQQRQPRHHQQRAQELTRLSSESESERRTPLEESRSCESEDTEEDLHTAEDDRLSILRTRLNSQVRSIRLGVGVHRTGRGEVSPPRPVSVFLSEAAGVRNVLALLPGTTFCRRQASGRATNWFSLHVYVLNLVTPRPPE